MGFLTPSSLTLTPQALVNIIDFFVRVFSCVSPRARGTIFQQFSLHSVPSLYLSSPQRGFAIQCLAHREFPMGTGAVQDAKGKKSFLCQQLEQLLLGSYYLLPQSNHLPLQGPVSRNSR